MNAEELKATLQTFYDNYQEIGVSVYAILKDKDNLKPLKIDIEGNACEGLKELFIKSLQDSISSREELSILNLSTSDERIDAIYLYDIEVPAELAVIDEVVKTDNLPLFDLKTSTLSSIKALLIEIGNNVGQIVLYKSMAPINIFGRATFFLKKSQHRLEKINEEFLRVSAGFQLLRINGELLVIDLEAIEKSFGFHDVIKREAVLGINEIEQMSLLDNPDVLRELLDDVRYARRFTKVARSSPVIKAGVPNASIINFCKTFPKLAGRIRFNAVEDKIMLDTKVSKDLFIKLLMDDFLTSELTNFHYASVAKDSVDDAEEGGT
jgi:hypothetical protein